MELYQLKYFRTLCRCRQYTRAADELFISPPALSTAIRKMEGEIGLPLTDRSGRTFTLTPAGEELLKTADIVMNELDSLQERLDSLTGQRIVIRIAVEHMAFSSSLMDSLDMFSQRYPNVEIAISRRAGRSIRQLITAGELDIGITLHQEEPHPGMDFEKYCTAEYGLYCPNPVKGGIVSLDSLRGKTVELLNYTGDMEAPLNRYFSGTGAVLRRGAITSLYPDTSWQLIKDGLGMAVFPLDLQKMDEKVYVYPFDPPLCLDYDFITPQNSPISRAIRLLKGFLRKEDAQ